MAFLYVIEETVIALVLLAVLAEIAVPLALGKPLFPIRRYWQRSRDLSAARDEIDAAQAAAEAEAYRRRADMIRNSANTEKEPTDDRPRT